MSYSMSRIACGSVNIFRACYHSYSALKSCTSVGSGKQAKGGIKAASTAGRRGSCGAEEDEISRAARPRRPAGQHTSSPSQYAAAIAATSLVTLSCIEDLCLVQTGGLWAGRLQNSHKLVSRCSCIHL